MDSVKSALGKIDFNRLLLIGALAVAGVYVVRKLGESAKDAATDAAAAVRNAFAELPTSDSYTARTVRVLTSPIVAPLSAAAIAITLPGEIKLTGNILFPNGTKISMNSVRVDSNLEFLDRAGVRWKIVSRTGENYLAQKV